MHSLVFLKPNSLELHYTVQNNHRAVTLVWLQKDNETTPKKILNSHISTNEWNEIILGTVQVIFNYQATHAKSLELLPFQR